MPLPPKTKISQCTHKNSAIGSKADVPFFLSDSWALPLCKKSLLSLPACWNKSGWFIRVTFLIRTFFPQGGFLSFGEKVKGRVMVNQYLPEPSFFFARRKLNRRLQLRLSFISKQKIILNFLCLLLCGFVHPSDVVLVSINRDARRTLLFKKKSKDPTSSTFPSLDFSEAR